MQRIGKKSDQLLLLHSIDDGSIYERTEGEWKDMGRHWDTKDHEEELGDRTLVIRTIKKEEKDERIQANDEKKDK